MDMSQRRTAITQLRRLLRRLERAHSGDETACPACALQQLAVQLVDEIEIESERAEVEDLRPGAASVVLAVESLIAAIYALGVQEADEQGRLIELLGQDGTLDELNRELCARIRSGDLDRSSPRLIAHLRTTTLDKLAVDQPKYSGVRQAEAEES